MQRLLPCFAAAGVAGLLFATAAGAQGRASTRSFQTLRADVQQVPAMRGIRELRVRWTPVSAAMRAQQPGARDAFVLLGERAMAGTLRRERRPELSGDRLVMVSVDRDGRELDWRLMLNPRLIRAEVPGPDGRLSGTTFEAPVAEVALAIPDLPGIERVDFYQPQWTGTGYVLAPLGTVQVGRR